MNGVEAPPGVKVMLDMFGAGAGAEVVKLTSLDAVLPLREVTVTVAV
jgi:hypothetical protein